MRTRDVSKVVSALMLAGGVALVAASCGTGNGDSLFNSDDGGNDDSTNDTSITGDGSGEGGFPEGGGNCKPRDCKGAGYSCGKNGDGCGGIIDCGSCMPPAYCGGGGYSKCGGNSNIGPDGGIACTPTTCQALGFDCGPAGDGCGNLLDCGMSCPKMGDYCGGGGPGKCGNMQQCVGLCKQQVACDGGMQTTITGRVVAGTIAQYGTPDPVPNVLVYVPNAPLQPFPPGVACGCPQASGDPLVYTTTAVDGTFSLVNVPVGNNIPVVIQLGRWRREVQFNINNQCTSSAVGDIHMPRTKTDGLNNQADIPFTALSTGNVDTMECVLLKMGVDQSEFTNPSGTGRINLYMGNGSDVTGGAPPEANLTGTVAELDKYDQVLFPCWGMPVDKNPGDLANVVAYTTAGGRMFATHYSYTWLYTNNPFDTTANWTNVNQMQFNQLTGVIDVTFPRGKTFGDWMTLIGAANGNPPTFAITSPRHDFDAPVAPSLRYVYSQNNGQFPLHYTFDTPWNQKNVCGRVIYSDFHVADTTGGGQVFPNECPAGGMNAQEKALEYMIWDLAACLGPQVPMCTPLDCKAQNIGCGPAGDGCGNKIDCGMCPMGQACVNYTCMAPDGGNGCTKQTCAQLGVNCGPAGDGCGGLLDCGQCVQPQTCGGGGQPGVCGGGTF
jgi:hypothetical protein